MSVLVVNRYWLVEEKERGEVERRAGAAGASAARLSERRQPHTPRLDYTRPPTARWTASRLGVLTVLLPASTTPRLLNRTTLPRATCALGDLPRQIHGASSTTLNRKAARAGRVSLN